MILLISLAIFSLVLVFNRFNPISLRQRLPSYKENFLSTKATFFLGALLILVYGTTTGFSMVATSPSIISEWGLNTTSFYSTKIYQLITNNFIHINWVHIYSNIIGLLILMPYEKRVGASRYITIFLICCIIASVTRLFTGQVQISVGASAGLYGLAVAYFIDKEDIWQKNWKKGIIVLSLIMLTLSFINNTSNITNTKVDHWGHFLGAFAAIIYIRINPIKPAKINLSNIYNRQSLPNIDHYESESETILGISSILVIIVFCAIIIISSVSNASSDSYMTKIMHSKFSGLKRLNPRCDFELLKTNPKAVGQACGALADKGNVDAMYILGEVLHLSNKPNLARQLYYNAALRDHADGLYRYAFYLEKAMGGENDLERATIAYKTASNLGQPVAQLRVAKMPDTTKEQSNQLYLKAKSKGVYDWSSLFIQEIPKDVKK